MSMINPLDQNPNLVILQRNVHNKKTLVTIVRRNVYYKKKIFPLVLDVFFQ